MSRRARSILVFVLGGALLSGCTGEEAPSAKPPETPPVRVVLPGKPGESARVTDSDQVRAPDGSTYSVIDITFVQMMIVHHAQAVEMAGLAAEHAGSPTLRKLAERISAAQRPEMDWLRAWLKARGQAESDPAHDHDAMPGMQSAADMTALAAARGADFDRRFVTMMIDHHRGALRMAGDVATGGSDEKLRETANEMSIEQASEIHRLEQLS